MSCGRTKVVPDLLYYTYQYVVTSIANKYKIPFSSPLDVVYLGQNNSFIRLLFDESWPSTLTSYQFLYTQVTDLLSVPDIIRRRMCIDIEKYAYYSTSVCGTGGNENIFDLQSEDLNMLDLLLQYRLDSTSVTSIMIKAIDYGSLLTNLSKLIYHYLNFKINGDYTLFDNSTPISDSDSVLENFYESYIVDIIFISISSFGLEANKPLIG